MIAPETVAEIRRLYYAEHWKVGTIAAALQLHPDTVKHALHIVVPRTRTSSTAGARVTEPYIAVIREILQRHPRLRATRLLEMLRDRGFTGSIYQLRRAVPALRPTPREAFFRLTTLPGEQAQVDWASFGKVQVGQARRDLSCFVMTLSYSRAFYLEFFFDQRMENFLQAHVNAFAFFGGPPRHLLYDNLKSAVLARHGDLIRFHPRLLELCGHYHFAALPCQPRRGNEKGRVERTIRYVRESFFAAREFVTLSLLNQQAWDWRDRVTLARPWPGDDVQRVGDIFDEERPRLLPLPAHPFETDLVQTVRSGKTIYVRFDLNDYSIPPAYVCRTLTLVASATQVRLLDGATAIARHVRSYERHQRIDDPAHLAALLEQKRKALGATAHGRLAHAVPDIATFLDAAFQRGESPARQTTQLLLLLDDYGTTALADAVREALANNTPRATSVAFILSRRVRRTRVPLPVDLSRAPHLADLSIPTHNLEAYDQLTQTNDNPDADNNADNNDHA
jgi:transposase